VGEESVVGEGGLGWKGMDVGIVIIGGFLSFCGSRINLFLFVNINVMI
jgi:hypothetical protein